MTKINIEPGILGILKAINNKIHFALGEFVDNSIQSFIENKDHLEKKIPGYRPKIEIIVEGKEIIIKDNCAGISKKDEERAFSLASANPNADQVGTFGMGMKVSACWFSDNWTVETKHIDEDEIKTFTVNVPKVSEGEMDIGPTRKKASGKSFTILTLKNCHERTIPHTTEIAILKRHISDIYRFFIDADIVDIYYNDELITYKAPEVKNIPLQEDQEKISKGILKPENAVSYLWIGDIERIDLGKNKKGKLWAEGEVWLRDQGITSGQRGFGIFWKNRLMEGVAGDPWMPGSDVWQIDDDEDNKKYAIYGGNNRGRNQRLEGYLHVSPNFNKSFQTNKLDWEGKALELAEKLKARLQDMPLRDTYSRNFNLIHQAEYAKWTKVSPPIKSPKPGEGGTNPGPPPIGPGGEGGTIDPPEPKPGPLPPIGENDEYVDRSYLFNEITYQVRIFLDNSDSDDYISHQLGPRDTNKEKVKELQIRINLGHIFIQKWFKGGFEEDEKEGLCRFGVAFVLAQEIAKQNKNRNKARYVLANFEAIIKDPSF